MINKLTNKEKNKIFTTLFNKSMQLIAVGFPGGYKFLVVLIITTFASTAVATDFSKIFFWIVLLVTFSGIPIASLMISPCIVITTQQKLLLIIISTSIGFFVAYTIELNQYNNNENFFIYLSVLCLSSYEVLKRYFLNEADFKSLFIASFFTLLLFILFIFTAFLLKKIGIEIILFSCFFSLVLPILILHIYKYKPEPSINSSFYDISINFVKYALSNATSTSLSFALPILLITEMGDIIATDLAQIFYFTTLTYLIPHALSAKHIPNMRKNGVRENEVNSFFTTILMFVVIVSVIYIPLLYYFYQQWLIYSLLFIAMQISQLSLPFSNILMIKGEASTLLRVNIISSTTFLILTSLIITQIPAKDSRAELLLLGFMGFQVLKLLLNYINSKQHVQHMS